MRKRRRTVTLASLFALVAAVAVVGVFSSAQAAGPPDPNTVGATTLSSIELNGVAGTTLTVAPGTSVSISANWSDSNSGCSGCIDFVAVGFAGQTAAPAGCIEDPGFDGESGSGSADLGDAPTTPGTYDVVAQFEEQYYCGGSGGYGITPPPYTSWDSGSGYVVIAEITVEGPPTATITSPADDQTYSVGQDAATSFVCADPSGPGIKSCLDSNGSASPGTLNTSTTGTFAYSVTATSTDGKSTTTTIHYTVAAPPTATITSPADDQTYNIGTDVATDFSCADPSGPGLKSCRDSNGSTSPGTLETSAAGTFAYSVTATSTDGQSTTTTIHYTVAGPPTATITSPADDQTYNLGTDVATDFSCGDPSGPGIATCVDSNGSTSPGALVTSTAGTFAYSVTATSTDGQSTTTTIHYTVVGPPTASITSPADGQTYAVGQDAATSFACADAANGPGIATCVDSNGSTSPGTLVTSATGTFAYSVTATSTDGQSSTTTIHYTVAGPPTATITSPADDQTYNLGQHVATDFSCDDPTGPGIGSCLDSNASGSPGALDTSTAGAFAYSVTATSDDGQSTTTMIHYTVVGPPTATITSPADDQTYAIGQDVATSFSCGEATNGPGVETCVDSNGSTSPGTLVTSATGTIAYSVTATSKDGQSTTTTIHYTVAGPPTATISSPADDQIYAIGQHVATSFSCDDGTNGPGIATCADSNGSASPGVLDTSTTGTFAYSVTATSTDGQSTTTTIHYTVAGPPTATITAPADDQIYNVGQHVTTTFACADPTGPGIGSCLDSNASGSPGTLDTSTAGTFAYSVTATSTDGQTTTTTIHYTVVGAPTATITSPADDQTYAAAQHVATTFACADAANGPGIATCVDSNGSASPGVLDTSTAGTFAYSVTATSTDGQTTTATIHYTVAGPPTATIASPADDQTYAIGQQATATFACADPAGPGIGSCLDSNASGSPGTLDTSTAGTFAYSVTATSTDGESTTTTIHYTVAGAPTATIGTPADDQTYSVGQAVATSFACADPSGPGIASCVDSNGSGSPGALDTSATGTFAYSVTATSTDGQTTTATIHYTVAGPPTLINPPAAPPVLASSSDLTPVAGTVTITLPNGSTFTPTSSTNIPLGSTIDAQSGTVSLTFALPNGTTQTGQFYDGEFVLTQSKDGTVDEKLAGSSFADCPRPKKGKHHSTKHHGARDAAAKTKKKPTTVVRQLWGNAHGKYTSSGRYGSASVSGTIWVTEDLCDGTLIKAIKDNVFVVAFAHPHKKHDILQGQSFFIPAPGYSASDG